MDRHYESITTTQTVEKPSRIIQYADLVEMVQLSVARQLDIPGALEANSFKELLAAYSSTEREYIICEIGLRFDEALVNFVAAAIIGQRHRLVIRAEASEGINGELFWKPQLDQRLETLNRKDDVFVEQPNLQKEEIEMLTQEAQIIAA